MDWEDIQRKPDVLFGIEVRKRREERKLTQRKLAKKIGINQPTLSTYELGQRPCPRFIRNRIEDYLGPIKSDLGLEEREDGSLMYGKTVTVKAAPEASVYSVPAMNDSKTQAADKDELACGLSEMMRRCGDLADDGLQLLDAAEFCEVRRYVRYMVYRQRHADGLAL